MLKTLKIELLKIKGSKLFLIATFFPILSIIQGIGFAQNMRGKGELNDFWMTFFPGSILLYGMLIFPMLIMIITAMIARVEHSNNGWKKLLTLPITRKNVYLSKLFLACGILLYNTAILSIDIIIAGISLGGEGPIPFNIIILRPMLAFVSALPIIAIQFYLSISFKHIGVPLGVGSMCILPIILIANSSKYWIFYPWTYPMLTIMPDFVTSVDMTIKYGIMYGVSIISFVLIIGVGLFN